MYIVRILRWIKRAQPRPYWFVVGPLVAYLVAELPIALPLLRATDHITMGIFVLSHVLIRGLLWFPLGIWGVFIRDLQLLAEYGGIFTYAGWSVYVVLIGAGLQYPRRVIFVVLVVLLILNMAGFQSKHVQDVACSSVTEFSVKESSGRWAHEAGAVAGAAWLSVVRYCDIRP